MEIKKCENCGSEHIHAITKEIGYSCSKCGRNTVRQNEMHQTNADRIRSMSDEELAMYMMCPNENGLAEIDCDKSGSCNCYECLLKWLQSEVEE